MRQNVDLTFLLKKMLRRDKRRTSYPWAVGLKADGTCYGPLVKKNTLWPGHFIKIHYFTTGPVTWRRDRTTRQVIILFDEETKFT